MYLNKAIVIGNLTRDPEIKALPSGIQVSTFSVATNRVWKDKNGDKQESVDYHNIVVFGKQAENVAQYLKKGSSALVEGRMQTRSWDAQDGSKKYRTEIVADRVQFGPRRDSVGSSSQKENSKDKEDDSSNDAPAIEYPTEDINPDDIPF
ncbi:MAG: single-stranded DNA-binding protein [Candidatus Zambryskibacteria bacterium CG_4_9_14_3_um_filter_40_16]|uniref:Single-stranded DNA-binding protein n=2 Tax=Candidatus Zambryskiibacteriota TaxID=1817925 RepID=A0A2H0K7F5_9BACT|nr:MAG: single-stranded DNA-binding protein [Candidatus Zambryskibacteria bacterium CG11_big_fil_rev_8_21_14_0_20_40_24]PJA33619.1 MAG: single-stranded DNA-binding protein [Candidatus Zambryskibacteria bacterium CG_4_9_14_3_um_filter_40_16]